MAIGRPVTRSAVSTSSSVLVCTPEYGYSMPAFDDLSLEVTGLQAGRVDAGARLGLWDVGGDDALFTLSR